MDVQQAFLVCPSPGIQGVHSFKQPYFHPLKEPRSQHLFCFHMQMQYLSHHQCESHKDLYFVKMQQAILFSSSTCEVIFWSYLVFDLQDEVGTHDMEYIFSRCQKPNFKYDDLSMAYFGTRSYKGRSCGIKTPIQRGIAKPNKTFALDLAKQGALMRL